MRVSRRLVNAIPSSWRRRYVDLRHAVRSVNSASRSLPDFLVIGTQRGGTSSLYKYLSSHPLVDPSLRKETEYFAGRYALGLDWYRANFPRSGRSTSPKKRMAFEATPDYMLHPLAAKRAHELVPEAKLIALLRDPVKRAQSHHRHMTRLGFEHLDFAEAVALEPERYADDLQRLEDDPLYRPTQLMRYSYLLRGHYAEHLERWIEEYGRDQLLVIQSERFYAETPVALEEIQEFLGLETHIPDDLPNYSVVTGPPDPIDAELEQKLVDYFRPHNARLEELLGVVTGWKG
jgi:hypothetical protein